MTPRKRCGAQEEPRRAHRHDLSDRARGGAADRCPVRHPTGINGKSPAERLAVRHEHSAPLMTELHAWSKAQLAQLSRNHDLAKAFNYMLRRWDAFTRFLDDGRV